MRPLCVNGCGRRAFAPFPTCCTRCAGPGGGHSRDCAAKNESGATASNAPRPAGYPAAPAAPAAPLAGVPAATSALAAAPAAAPAAAAAAAAEAADPTNSQGVAAAASPPLCVHGCGRRAFAPFPTCCTRCAGPGSRHSRDCAAKNESGATASNAPRPAGYGPGPMQPAAPHAEVASAAVDFVLGGVDLGVVAASPGLQAADPTSGRSVAGASTWPDPAPAGPAPDLGASAGAAGPALAADAPQACDVC